MGFGVWGLALGFGIWGLKFRVVGLGFEVERLALRVQAAVPGGGFGVQGLVVP